MGRLIRMLTVNALMYLVVASSAIAQITPENPSKLPEQAKIEIAQVHVPVALTSESRAVRPQEVNLQGEVSPSVSFLDEDVNGMLSAFSEMLNEGAAQRAGNSSESLRRNAIFSTEESLASQFLSSSSVKQSV